MTEPVLHEVLDSPSGVFCSYRSPLPASSSGCARPWHLGSDWLCVRETSHILHILKQISRCSPCTPTTWSFQWVLQGAGLAGLPDCAVNMADYCNTAGDLNSFRAKTAMEMNCVSRRKDKSIGPWSWHINPGMHLSWQCRRGKMPIK